MIHTWQCEPKPMQMLTMKEMIKYITQSLVDNPGKVEVNEVIGKQGRTVQAIRTILSAASAKVHKRAVLEILE